MTPEPHDLVSFMRSMCERMSEDYDRIQRRAREDPGTAGDQGEENWARLLREWLPATYQIVTKGRILSHEGVASPQVDVLVLAPSYPRHLLDTKLYLAGGVLAAFECKTTLKAEHIAKALETAASIQAMLPRRWGSPYRELFTPLCFGLLAHSHAWNAAQSEIGKRVLSYLVEGDRKVVTHPSQTIDLICIADLGVWHCSKSPWMGPETLNKGEPGAREYYLKGAHRIFGPEGSATTEYLGALRPDVEGEQAPGFTPIGAFLTRLLRRLAWEDRSLRALASYFRDARMEGHGSGFHRRWDASTYSEFIRQDVVSGSRLRSVVSPKPWDGDDLWDEWGLHFS